MMTLPKKPASRGVWEQGEVSNTINADRSRGGSVTLFQRALQVLLFKNVVLFLNLIIII